MDSVNTSPSIDSKMIIIVFLVILLIISAMGINIFYVMGNVYQVMLNLFGPLLRAMGYATGTVLNTSVGLVADTTKDGITVVENGIQSVGTALKQGSFDSTLNNTKPLSSDFQPTDTGFMTGANNANWCLLGEFEGRRGCALVNSPDKCASGKLFPTSQQCTSPPSTNALPVDTVQQDMNRYSQANLYPLKTNDLVIPRISNFS